MITENNKQVQPKKIKVRTEINEKLIDTINTGTILSVRNSENCFYGYIIFGRNISSKVEPKIFFKSKDFQESLNRMPRRKEIINFKINKNAKGFIATNFSEVTNNNIEPEKVKTNKVLPISAVKSIEPTTHQVWWEIGENMKIYCKAQAYGADNIVLSTEIGAKIFIETKKEIKADSESKLIYFSNVLFFIFIRFNDSE